MFRGLLTTGAIHQNSAHGLRRRGEKVSTTLKVLVILVGEPQPRFMHERGRLESVAGSFVRHLVSGEFAQLLVNQREQLIGSFGVALLNTVEDTSDVAHARRLCDRHGK